MVSASIETRIVPKEGSKPHELAGRVLMALFEVDFFAMQQGKTGLKLDLIVSNHLEDD